MFTTSINEGYEKALYYKCVILKLLFLLQKILFSLCRPKSNLYHTSVCNAGDNTLNILISTPPCLW